MPYTFFRYLANQPSRQLRPLNKNESIKNPCLKQTRCNERCMTLNDPARIRKKIFREPSKFSKVLCMISNTRSTLFKRENRWKNAQNFKKSTVFVSTGRMGFAHRFPGVYVFVLVGGAHPAKNMPEWRCLSGYINSSPNVVETRVKPYCMAVFS